MADTKIKASLSNTTAEGPGPRSVPSLNLNNIPMGQWDALLSRGPYWGNYGYGYGYPRAGVQPGSPFSPGIGGTPYPTDGVPSGFGNAGGSFSNAPMSGGGGGYMPPPPPQPMDVKFVDPGISRASFGHPLNVALDEADAKRQENAMLVRQASATAQRMNPKRFPWLTPTGEE